MIMIKLAVTSRGKSGPGARRWCVESNVRYPMGCGKQYGNLLSRNWNWTQSNSESRVRPENAALICHVYLVLRQDVSFLPKWAIDDIVS